MGVCVFNLCFTHELSRQVYSKTSCLQDANQCPANQWRVVRECDTSLEFRLCMEDIHHGEEHKAVVPVHNTQSAASVGEMEHMPLNQRLSASQASLDALKKEYIMQWVNLGEQESTGHEMINNAIENAPAGGKLREIHEVYQKVQSLQNMTSLHGDAKLIVGNSKEPDEKVWKCSVCGRLTVRTQQTCRVCATNQDYDFNPREENDERSLTSGMNSTLGGKYKVLQRKSLRKNDEEIITNQVLWMALIRWIGKRKSAPGNNTDGLGCAVVSPNGSFRTVWDTISLVLISYVLVFTPFQVSFMTCPLMDTRITSAGSWTITSGCLTGQIPCFNYLGIFVFDFFIDIFFAIDIVVNLRSAWIDENPYSNTFKHTKYDCRTAFCRYLKGLLVVDILSLLPFWLLELEGSLFVSGVLLRMPRLLRLARLFKLFRVLRASTLFQRWAKSIAICCRQSTQTMVSILLTIAISIHIMACAWYERLPSKYHPHTFDAHA